MTSLKFEKYQGLGNDFVLFSGDELRYFAEPKPDTIRRICDRRFGIGGDGILLAMRPSTGGATRMIYYNADGSFAETCFNGLRCIALHAARHGLARHDETFIIESPTGPITAMVAGGDGPASIEMAGPTFEPSKVPVQSAAEIIDRELGFAGFSLTGTALSIGNPHFVVWRENSSLSDLRVESERIGGAIEKAPVFPKFTNFELATVLHRTSIEMAVWERGVGPTLACGSGATATVCAGVRTGRLDADKPVKVRMPGGELSVEVDSKLKLARVVGGAEFVFSGEIDAGKVGL
jgi:diaminopimelate epimerase